MRPKYTKHMPLQEVWVFPVALVIKNLPVIAEDVRDISSIPRSGRSPGGGHGNPLLYFSPGQSRGQRSRADYSAWGHKKLDMTKVP